MNLIWDYDIKHLAGQVVKKKKKKKKKQGLIKSHVCE